MRIIPKPWGQEELIEHNEKYMMKKLLMNKGHRCSLQYHNFKIETIYVLEGQLLISVGTKEEELISEIYNPGSFITLRPGIIHRMEALSNCIYLEASTPEIEDVVRINDDYNREK